MFINFGIMGGFLGFLWQRKLWWLIPMVTLLMLFGTLMVIATTSGIGPFIYTLF